MSAINPTFGEIRYQLAQSFPGTSLELITSFLNGRYRTIARKLKWTDLSVQAVLSTVAPYETGTVTLTNGSTAVTGASTVWTALMAGRGFRVTGDEAYYQFTYAGATSGTLDRAYEGSTGSALTYKIFQSIFVLPSDCRLLRTMRVLGSPRDLDQISQEMLDERAPNRSEYGEPRMYAPHMVESSTPPRQQVELYPIPDAVESIPFWYVQNPALFEVNDTAVFLPTFFDPATLLRGVESDVLRIVQKDYAGAAAAEALYREALGEMVMQESARRGPVPLKIHTRYTVHRQARTLRGSRGVGFRLP